ncbi:uncharacterized protein LOC120538560 [Polypterus senegalus]|uniref:uncharacterized protein LOC120538560 n=1 Tax=Polypterus senegalus TaxID=55291 RepID=UPI0019631B45|nr:uncharacterized protein LOC120538560 [Polypterus senegalus]
METIGPDTASQQRDVCETIEGKQGLASLYRDRKWYLLGWSSHFGSLDMEKVHGHQTSQEGSRMVLAHSDPKALPLQLLSSLLGDQSINSKHESDKEKLGSEAEAFELENALVGGVINQLLKEVKPGVVNGSATRSILRLVVDDCMEEGDYDSCLEALNKAKELISQVQNDTGKSMKIESAPPDVEVKEEIPKKKDILEGKAVFAVALVLPLMVMLGFCMIRAFKRKKTGQAEESEMEAKRLLSTPRLAN